MLFFNLRRSHTGTKTRTREHAHTRTPLQRPWPLARFSLIGLLSWGANDRGASRRQTFIWGYWERKLISPRFPVRASALHTHIKPSLEGSLRVWHSDSLFVSFTLAHRHTHTVFFFFPFLPPYRSTTNSMRLTFWGEWDKPSANYDTSTVQVQRSHYCQKQAATWTCMCGGARTCRFRGAINRWQQPDVTLTLSVTQRRAKGELTFLGLHL